MSCFKWEFDEIIFYEVDMTLHFTHFLFSHLELFGWHICPQATFWSLQGHARAHLAVQVHPSSALHFLVLFERFEPGI